MSDLKERLRKSYALDNNYPTGREGWELYLLDRISTLERVAEAAKAFMYADSGADWMSYRISLERELGAAGYLKEEL